MDTTTGTTDTTPDGRPGSDAFERLNRALDEWRGRIDELVVRADLASKEVRDDARQKASVAENACLAAKRRLGEMPHDTGANLRSFLEGIEKLLDDVRLAFQSAEAVIRRDRENGAE